MEINKISVDTAELAYHVFGTGKIDLVIEMGLGAVMGEWWQLAKRLSEHHTVLLYERAGYGLSGASELARTPENIAKELYRLLNAIGHEEQVTILAHSQGGLYAQQFARLYPAVVKKLVLLDPLSPEDNSFRTKLSDTEFRKGGIDKTAGLRLNLRLTRLHLGWLVRRVMRTAPPFYYSKDFTDEETTYILNAVSKPLIYETALKEYAAAHDENCLKGLTSCEGFPAIPVVLVTHDSDIEKKEICDFGGASIEEAQKIEDVWQQIMSGYLSYSPDHMHIRAEHSSHYIHLTDADLVVRLVSES